MFVPQIVKHHSLTGRLTLGLLDRAWQQVARNRGVPGVDGVSIHQFGYNRLENLASLVQDLKGGTYQPLPVLRVYLPKGDGQWRPLGIPTVRDRVAQEVLRRLLLPLYEPLFHAHSYGARPGRSCHQALRQLREFHRRQYRYVLDADIQGFYDQLPHAVVMRGLSYVIADGNILTLVETILKAGVSEEAVVHPTTVGTPQGGPLSPLLANVALHFLDRHLDDLGYRFVRYADDFVVVCRSAHRAREARLQVEQYLNEELGLTLHREKTCVTSFREGFTFLGFELGSHSCRMREKAVERFKTQIRTLTIRSRNLDAAVVQKLNAVVRGVGNYFGVAFATCYSQFERLDRWYRMRLRCMKYKRKSQRDNWRLRTQRLRRLGVVFLQDVRQQLRC